jgi:hypothetical protein
VNEREGEGGREGGRGWEGGGDGPWRVRERNYPHMGWHIPLPSAQSSEATATLGSLRHIETFPTKGRPTDQLALRRLAPNRVALPAASRAACVSMLPARSPGAVVTTAVSRWKGEDRFVEGPVERRARSLQRFARERR